MLPFSGLDEVWLESMLVGIESYSYLLVKWIPRTYM